MAGVAGKVLIVTGATGNLGQAVATAAREGAAKVVLAGRSIGSLTRTFPGAEADPNVLLAAEVDLGDLASMQNLANATLAKFGRIDGLLNTVGGFAIAPVAEDGWATFEAMLAVNLKSAFNATVAVLPAMKRQGAGRIVEVGAGAAVKSSGGLAAYAASKAGVMRLVESLADEVRADGLTVNCVLPGIIDTPQNRAAMPDADRSGWVSPAAIADTMLWLATDAARAVSGALVPVTGRG